MKYILFFLLIQVNVSSFSQKMDHNWLLGYNEPQTLYFDGSKLDFNDNKLKIKLQKFKTSFDRTNLSMSDSLGNLIFYSNGFSIGGSDFEILENGDDLNFCKSIGCSVTGWGLVNFQGIICFPFKNNKYKILHNQVNFVTKNNVFAPFSLNLLSTEVELDNSFGTYKVLNKNKEILVDTLGPGALVSTKHANGRDWWCILKKGNSKEFFTVLVTPDSVYINPIQKFETIPFVNFGHGCFTPDGAKYIFQEIEGKGNDYIIIFNFDRCNGQLTNPIVLKTNFYDNGAYGGITVSPNGRFLYISQNPWLMQLDLDSLNLNNPFDTIAEYDGFESPFKTYFFYMQNGPDGKIYMCASNAVNILHVINNPDEKGKACNFTQHSVKLISPNSFSLPNFPNYRLGPLVGSGCDTLTSTITYHNKDKLNIYPNPAYEHFKIEYSGSSGFQKEMEFQLMDLTGKVLLKEHLAVYSLYRDIDVTGLSPGMYIWQVIEGNEVIESGKVVVIK